MSLSGLNGWYCQFDGIQNPEGWTSGGAQGGTILIHSLEWEDSSIVGGTIYNWDARPYK